MGQHAIVEENFVIVIFLLMFKLIHYFCKIVVKCRKEYRSTAWTNVFFSTFDQRPTNVSQRVTMK